jgi:hypothetical protein
MIEGRRRLLEILKRTRRDFVAFRCRVTRATVNGWCAGHKTPGRRARRALSVNYGIPLGSWGKRL